MTLLVAPGLPAMPPPVFDGNEAFNLLFASLPGDARSRAVGCSLRRIFPDNRLYLDSLSLQAGMFDDDLIRWLAGAVSAGVLARDKCAGGDEAQVLKLVHVLASSAPAPPASMAASAPLAAGASDYPRRVAVSTSIGEDGNKRAETSAFGELDYFGAMEMAKGASAIDAALAHRGPTAERAQLCANLGRTTYDASGKIATHVNDDALTWAVAKDIPESLVQNGGPIMAEA